MTTPRDAEPVIEGGAAGASRISGGVEAAKARWAWVQGLRPWRAFSHFTNVGGAVLSAGMSYQALFAVFAALWVGFGVLDIWLRARPDLLESLIAQINVLVPGLLGEHGVVSLTMLLQQRTLDWVSLVAGLSLLWVTISWFTGTRRAIRIIFGLEVKQYRNAVLLKLRDLALAVLFLVALIVSAALTVFSTNLTNWLFDVLGLDGDSWLLSGVGVIARYALLYVFDVLVLLAIHVVLAEVRVRRRTLITGCMAGGAVLLGLKMLGSMLLGGASSNPLLASFAVLIGLLIWFNLICRALLLTAAWIATGVDHELGLPNSRVTFLEV